MAVCRKLALAVEYEGTRYHGFQVQRNDPSVQGVLEEALYRLTGEQVRIQGASRTDAGAHALAQVVAFTTQAAYPPETVLRALNFYLPEDVKVRAAAEVPLTFDPRRHATGRWYRYTIVNRPTPSPLLRRFAHWVPEALDVAAMTEAATLLLGTRDFAPLAGGVPPGRTTVRRLTRWNVRQQGELIVMDVEGNAFLPQQVRKTAGALVLVGQRRLTPTDISRLLTGDQLPVQVPVLPAQGLCLMAVRYASPPVQVPEGLALSCIMVEGVTTGVPEQK